MPKFTVIPEEFREEHKNKWKDIKTEDIPELAEKHPDIFAKYFLGKTLRLHQAFIMSIILWCIEQKFMRLAMCLARQLGKSVFLGIFLIWCCWYNKIPKTILNITACYIISRDDDASVELLDKIRGVLRDGDKHMLQYQDDPTFFTGSLKEPNNTHQVTWLNGCFIKSIPPTGAVLGKSASIVVIDEAHRLKCDDPDKFFNQFVMPTVAETGGLVILSSSPEGIVGFFYEAINPEEKEQQQIYQKIWFDHSIWDDDTDECKTYQKFVQDEKIRLTAEGNIKSWQQEYGALFTVTATSFFEHDDIQDAITDTPQTYEWKETPCSLGIDYGMKTSRTVLTIRSMIRKEIIQVFQYRCSAGFDINELVNPKWEHSIQRLKQRYKLTDIVVDDCPQGDSTNKWLEKNSGLPVKKYNFRSDQMSKSDGVNRNCAAYSYRAALKRGILKIPKWNKIQHFEMKIVQEVEQKVLISIKAPQGQLCDTFDSDMMASIPFLDMQDIRDLDFGDDLTDKQAEDLEMRKIHGKRYDSGSFKRLSDDQCRDLIAEANAKLLEPEV